MPCIKEVGNIKCQYCQRLWRPLLPYRRFALAGATDTGQVGASAQAAPNACSRMSETRGPLFLPKGGNAQKLTTLSQRNA